MKKLLLHCIILVVVGLIAGCSIAQTAIPNTQPTQYPISTPRDNFHPGDPTSMPPGSEITDLDFQAGVAAYKIKDFVQVENLMEKVIDRNPELAPPYWYLGRAMYEKHDYESALQLMNKALSIDPNYALAYADRGLANFALGNESQGLADFQHALELDPSLAKVHHNLAVRYYNQGEMSLALEEYDLALQIDPTRASAWVDRAETLYMLRRLEECIESATNAIDNNPQTWKAYLVRGSCYVETGNDEQGISDINVALANNGGDAETIAAACAVTTHIKINDKAVEYCTQSMTLEPTRHESIINRGVAYFNLGNYHAALDDFTHALEFGEIPVAYQNRGNAHMKLFEFEEAVDDYQRSLALYPNGYVYYSLGFAYIQLNKYQEALAAFEQGDQLEPERSFENYRLMGKANAYDKLEQDDQAMALYTQLIDQYQRIEAYYFRGRIYEAKAMNSEALADYQVFLELAKQVPDDSYIQMLVYDANERQEELQR